MNAPTDPLTSGKPDALDLAAILATSGQKQKRGRGKWLLVLCLLLIGGGLGFYLYGSGDGQQFDYTTQAAKTGDLQVIVTATGSIQPTDQVDISSELSGTVRKVNVSYNSPVKAGEVLLELDTNRQEADVQSARAQLASARANVLKAKAEAASAKISFDRLTSLVSNRISSQQDLDAAKYAYDSAVASTDINEAAVLSAEASLRLAEINLSKLKIVSPIDGVVLTRDVDPGATVASSLNAPVLFTIAGDLKHMELQVAVDEADVGQVREGQEARFSVDAYPNRHFPAKIESVRFASETVNNVVTYKAILTVDNEDLLLRPGMTATSDITVQSVTGALLVPNAALRYSPPSTMQPRGSFLSRLFSPPRPRGNRGARNDASAASRSVWVLRNGSPERVSVEMGATDGQFTVVKSPDLKDGDLLITEATARGR
ncbi:MULTISPECIES: efflux RND transporter periplasmic adaptor subunit [Rhizobiaceae]|uniref:HlyD family secretion protein n=1 Tax=Aliirhizobium cellulosilyticum TaxID=393664 RepID=A0A7W6WP37_9HYPH|nr:HlyD family secretion protein [Rhizobium cellulosilyticum]MBB4410050.1 HlyD family secretion protein [Rhizobium cellulosilyticum]MBB4444737.1 HlyD family secretion protein [Rhizobium cellulosilyticum]